MNSSCPSSTPRLKKSNATGIADCGRPTYIQRAGEAEAMQQTEGERDEPRKFLGQTGHALSAMDDFCRDKHDAQRDGGFDGWPRHMHESERRAREGEAVRESERRDRRNDPARAFHQNQQREDEQQMVDTEKNMSDTQF